MTESQHCRSYLNKWVIVRKSFQDPSWSCVSVASSLTSADLFSSSVVAHSDNCQSHLMQWMLSAPSSWTKGSTWGPSTLTRSSPRESRLTNSNNSSKLRTFSRPEATLTFWWDSLCLKQLNNSQLQDEVASRAIAIKEGEHSKDVKIQLDRSQKSQIYWILLR